MPLGECLRRKLKFATLLHFVPQMTPQAAMITKIYHVL